MDNADELVAGFPKTREELFAYRGLVLGSIEAGAFTGDQLRMIAEFVDRRGGGLLALGGPRAFSEGGYAGTAVADTLPVVLDGNLRQKDGERDPAAGAADARGLGQRRHAGGGHRGGLGGAVEHAARRHRGESPRRHQARRHGAALGAGRLATRLSRCSSSSATGAARRSRSRRRTRGCGRCTRAIAVEDLTHENFWRQLLRWVVDEVPDQVEIRTSSDRVEPGSTVTLHGRGRPTRRSSN